MHGEDATADLFPENDVVVQLYIFRLVGGADDDDVTFEQELVAGEGRELIKDLWEGQVAAMEGDPFMNVYSGFIIVEINVLTDSDGFHDGMQGLAVDGEIDESRQLGNSIPHG